MAPFVQISTRFQILFKIWTICNPTSFCPFEVQISPDFRSSLYCKINFFCRRIFEAVQTLCWGRSSSSCHHQSFQTSNKLGNFTPLDLYLTFNRVVPSGLGQSAKFVWHYLCWHNVKNHLKFGWKHPDFEWSGFQVVRTKAITIAKTGPFEIRHSKCPDFKCSGISDGRISDPHCIPRNTKVSHCGPNLTSSLSLIMPLAVP